jgi:DNA-cytosine methyltransferase
MVRVLDLYCGMGGLSLGLALALEGVEIRGVDIDGVAVATYNLNLSKLGAKAERADVVRWEPSGEYDLVVGGPPCQPFSLANTKRRGEEHPLFPTFPRFFDVVLGLRPRAFLMENVRGLLTERNSHYLREQLARASEHYVVRYKVLNAADYGVPQRRERLILIGFRRDLGVVPRFPPETHGREGRETLDGGRLHGWVTLGEAIGDLLSLQPENGKKLVQTNPRHGKLVNLGGPARTVKVDGRGGDFCFDTMPVPLRPEQAERIRREREDTSRDRGRMEFPDGLDEPSRTISSHTVEGTKGETIVLPAILFRDSKGEVVEIPWTPYQSKHPPMSPDEPASAVTAHIAKWSRDGLIQVRDHVTTEGGEWDNERSDWGSRVMSPDRPYYTITEKHRSGQLVPIPPVAEGAMTQPSPTPVADAEKGVYRRLTVRECLRLQSFPDWWAFPEKTSVSRRYRLVGEAVPPVLAYRLALHLGRALGLRTREPPKREEWDLPYFERAFADYL